MTPLFIIIITCIVLFCICIIIQFYQNKKLKTEGFNITLDYKRDTDVSNLVENAEIPLKLFQTWHTKTLPPKMKYFVDKLKRDNPEFKHYLFDDNDCREFIREFFPDSVLDAFDQIVPGAYKADLWRYCVLYIYGGIYLDIKFQCIDGFKLIELTQKEYYVRDRKWDEVGIYNALLVCKPNNEILHKCIYAIVDNVKNKYYGINPLQPTGPQLMNKFFTPSEIKNMELSLDPGGQYINYTNSKNDTFHIMYPYPDYRTEQQQLSKTPYYAHLWRQKAIYN